MKWYFEVLRRYGDFRGRASLKEYWMFAAINLVISLVFMLLDNYLDIDFPSVTADFSPITLPYEGGPFFFAYALIVLLPGFAVSVRRLHDVDKSAWNLLKGLIPIVGPLLLLSLFTRNSYPLDNRYGQPRKTGAGEAKTK